MKSSEVLFREKFYWYIGLSLLTCVLYFGIQNFPFNKVYLLPMSYVEKSIVFNSGWVWIYQSIYAVTPLVPLLILERRNFYRYVQSYFILLCLCSVCFIFFPISAPRPDDIQLDTVGFMYRFILWYDGTINCIPSLHIGLAFISWAYFDIVVLERAWYRYVCNFFMGSWFLLLCFSTLALKQHYFIDVISGIIAGALSFMITSKVQGVLQKG